VAKRYQKDKKIHGVKGSKGPVVKKNSKSKEFIRRSAQRKEYRGPIGQGGKGVKECRGQGIQMSGAGVNTSYVVRRGEFCKQGNMNEALVNTHIANVLCWIFILFTV
jgi:hypothetical protein